MSVGLEDTEDILEDLKQALEVRTYITIYTLLLFSPNLFSTVIVNFIVTYYILIWNTGILLVH